MLINQVPCHVGELYMWYALIVFAQSHMIIP
jgi:hypothetical protein